MFKNKFKIKYILETLSFILIIFLSFLMYRACFNFSATASSYNILKQSVNFQIDTLNQISKNLPSISDDKKEAYINKEINNLYKIQKKGNNGELIDIVKNVYFEKNNEYSITILMLPSSHTCMFLDKTKDLIGKTISQGLSKKDFDCTKDNVLIKYYI